jgi:antirestriction protein
MNTSPHLAARPIQAHQVPDEARIETLPRHFGRHMLAVEDAVYRFMRQLAKDYSGGYWHFYELSNGGFYMAPECEPLVLQVEGNGYAGRLSAEAAGITACLFALSHLTFRIPDQLISDHYYLLRDFALEHSEASAILAAID